MKRRDFIIGLGAVFLAGHTSALSRGILWTDTDRDATMRYIFQSIIKNLSLSGAEKEPIGEVVGQVARLFLGTPYVGGTLEGSGPEQCRFDLTGLDCVTLIENALCIARTVKKGNPTFEGYLDELQFTRYRRGILTDYTSRLHYTSDWLDDNEQKGVVQNITASLKGTPFPNMVNFMTSNVQYYKPLQENPNFVSTMRAIEDNINSREHLYIPKNQVRSIEKQLQEGDIIAITTSKEGLDCAHVGIAVKEKNAIRLLHASLTKKKVIIDSAPSRYLGSVKSHSGIMVARPLEPVEQR